MFSLPARISKSKFGLAIKIYLLYFEYERHLVVEQGITCKYIAEFHPEEHADIVVLTVKIISRRHRHLIYIVKRNIKTDGMGLFISFTLLFMAFLWGGKLLPLPHI